MAFPTQSISLNGSSQYLTRAKTGSSNLYVTGSFTWESWVKSNSLPTLNTQQTLYVQSWAAGGNLSFNINLVNIAAVTSINFRGGSSGNQDFNVLLASGLSISAATWYHMALVYTAGTHTAEFFLDGVSQGSTSATITTSLFNGTDPIVIGAEGDFSNKWNGRFVLTRFWSTTRTAAQISANRCTILGATASLGGEWTFDNTANDNSGNSNTLTPTGTPTYSADTPAACAVVVVATNFLSLLGVGT